MKTLTILKQHFILHPSGAIFWRETKTWLFADIHLGKVAHFRKHGIAVPRKAEGDFYQKSTKLFALYQPERVLFLGDLFHSFKNNEWHLFEAWVKQQNAKMVLIEGNHDIIPAEKFTSLGIVVRKEMTEKGFLFSHFPKEKTTGHFVFCGHLHPGVILRGIGKQVLKLPCFFQSPSQLILPAFGVFTGLHILNPTKKNTVYVCTEKEVMEIDRQPRKNYL